MKLIQGASYLLVAIGALRLVLEKLGVDDFNLHAIPSWCYGALASLGGLLFCLAPMVYGSGAATREGSSSGDPDRMLFLYLRPFELDARNTLQLVMGISSGVAIYFSLEWTWLLWPFSVVPFLVNISKEQSLHDALAPLGRFIAVGRPSERLQPIGASRIYITGNWMQTVEEHITQARLVIVRPGESPGIQWEIKQVLKKVPPERILFYLRSKGGRRAREKEYEDFRNLVQSSCPAELPAQPENARYLIFDSSWRAHFLNEDNRPLSLVKQLFAPSGDITRDRLRPILKELNIEVPTQVNKLPDAFATGYLWLFALVSVCMVLGTVIIATVRILSVFMMYLLSRH